MKGYEIMSDANKEFCVSLLRNCGYTSEVDLVDVTELEKGDIIVEVADVNSFELKNYEEQMSRDEFYVQNPKTVISSWRTRAKELADRGLREKPRQGLSEIERTILKDFTDIRNMLAKTSGAHLYKVAFSRNADGKILSLLETIR